jgi:5-dehydro-4-deoxyglucarate dehydratase
VIGPDDLRGLWGFALTPFRGEGVDELAYRAGVERLADGGADVVIAGGTLGQGDRMSDVERVGCVRLARAAAGAPVPLLGVLVAGEGVGDAASALRDAGADGALLLPASGEVAAVARAIAAVERATHGRLPLVLYQRGALLLEPAELRELASSASLIGLKDAHGDLRRFRRLWQALGERLVWIGASEDLAVAYLTHGADAVSPASMAYAPGYAARWWGALQDGDVRGAVELLRRFAWPVTDLRLSRPDIDITVVHELARRFGREVGSPRPPAQPLEPAEIAEVERLAGVLRTLLGLDRGAVVSGRAAGDGRS